MHELAVTESILQICLNAAHAHDGRRITDIYLKIGQWSSIVDDSVKFYWDMISEGTQAQGATLHFERIPTELFCLDCATVYRPANDDITCPKCGSTRIQVRHGNEFSVEAIEIEDKLPDEANTG
jgi:hydrogenase nickel incorporation protein HypA/HybF